MSEVPVFARPPVKDLSGELPIPDYLDSVIACNTPPPYMGRRPLPPLPKSAWLESERVLYQEVLAKQPVDILIAPLQVQGYGLDRIERSLMTAELAYAIGDASSYRIADPFLVARALGEGARRIDDVELQRLALKVGAKKIITGYVGHDRHHAFTLTLQVREQSAAPAGPQYRQVVQRDWRGVAFTDERTPALVLSERLPEVLHQLPLDISAGRADLGVTPSTAAVRIAKSPRELIADDSGSSAVAAFDLLGALGSVQSDLSRERAFERALLVSLHGKPSGHLSDRFFKAYALMQLWRRPSALAALQGETAPESVALIALLNGDLPAAEASLARVPQSLQRLLLDIAVRDLQSTYHRKLQARPAASAEAFGPASAQWAPWVELRSQDSDPWGVPDALDVKSLLDRNLPVAGFDAKSIVAGNALTAAARNDEIEIDLANERHVRRVAAQIQPAACCKTSALRPAQWDLLWLLEGMADGRISKSLDVQINSQALAQHAMEEIHRYEPLLNGQPSLELRRLQAAARLYEKSTEDTRDNWIALGEQAAELAAYYSAGQNATAFHALESASPRSVYMIDAYGYDYPRRPFWPIQAFPTDTEQERIERAVEALAFSTSDPEDIGALPPGDAPGHAGAFIAAMGSRFRGNPRRPGPNIESATPLTPPQLIARLEDAIKSDPELWTNYQVLGEYIVTSGGSYQAARDAFLRFPGFKDAHPQDPVAVSNYAYAAGAKLFWQGMPALAQPLYKIAADLDTGSQASIESEARLALLRGDYRGFAGLSVQNAQRYQSPYEFRDFLSFLHAFGRSEYAWQAFSQLKTSFPSPQVWVSALVGHERQSFRNSDVRAWLLQPENRDAQLHSVRFAPYYAILWAATDHTPDEGFSQLVEQLGGPRSARVDSDGHTTLVPGSDKDSLAIIHPSALHLGKSAKSPPATFIDSELTYFARAYSAVRSGNYDAAVTGFAAMADHYPIEGYPLAYFAYSAARTADKEQLEKYLQSLPSPPSEFDSSIAKAFFAGSRHDNDGALKALTSAVRALPLPDDGRPVLPEYEYAQACEWLLKDTADPRFKDALLDWVSKQQVIRPTQGWAYAMQYTYAHPGPERTRALAIARYLDPASSRIQSASRAEIDAAQTWFGEHNPFRLPDPQAPHPKSIAARPDTHSPS